MLRIPHCLDNRFTDSGKVVSLRTGRALLPRNIIIFMYLVLISVRGRVNHRLQGLCKYKIQLVGSRTRGLRLVAYCLKHYTTACPIILITIIIIIIIIISQLVYSSFIKLKHDRQYLNANYCLQYQVSTISVGLWGVQSITFWFRINYRFQCGSVGFSIGIFR
jgi:hypothetical protein